MKPKPEKKLASSIKSTDKFDAEKYYLENKDAIHAKTILSIIEKINLDDKDSINEANEYLIQKPINLNVLLLVLSDLLTTDDEVREKIKSNKFNPVRAKGAEANKNKAAINKSFILKENEDLLKHISWARKTLDDRAEHISKVCETHRIKMANGKPYSVSYIRKLITGK